MINTEVLKKRFKIFYEVIHDESELYHKFRAYQKSKADELGFSEFRIAPDEVLQEMAMMKPQSIPELYQICGLGQIRIHDFGEDFISIVKSHLESIGTDPEGNKLNY